MNWQETFEWLRLNEGRVDFTSDGRVLVIVKGPSAIWSHWGPYLQLPQVCTMIATCIQNDRVIGGVVRTRRGRY